jgi:hypothetical protein
VPDMVFALQRKQHKNMISSRCFIRRQKHMASFTRVKKM